MSIKETVPDTTIGEKDTLAAPAGSTPAAATAGTPISYTDPDRYELGDELARGAMGRIRKARDRRLDRPVAVKELLGASAAMISRFEREARVTARLEHPAIVPVHDVGVLPSGEPFYAMKLVSGRSLDQAVDDARSPAERMALLPNVLAVVEALAYAHSQRIIHRDLKPLNVLVGPFGETVVIDWGLAKDLAAAPELCHDRGDDAAPVTTAAGSHAGRSSATGSDEKLTVAGAVLGTPAYMPPEQAAGKVVDERADVYALGAMLYHVLAGVPPYPGTDSHKIILRVVTEPPVPLRERQPGLPDDLLAIVDKAMAREPDARYRSAQELAADLRRLQTGQLVGAHRYTLGERIVRFVRRNRAAVIVGAVLATLLAVISVVSVRRIMRERDSSEQSRHAALASRSLALSQRGAAEELVEFMLSDLRDRLESVGRLDLLESVGERVEKYYGAIGPDSDDPNGVLKRRVDALRLLGEARMAKGDAAGAMAAHRARLALAIELGKPEYVASSHNSIGDMHMRQGDLDEALASYREALVHAKASGNERAQWTVLVRIGMALLEQGDTGGALASYREALVLARRLAVAGDPDKTESQVNLSVNLGQLGDVLVRRGDLDGGLASYRESRDVMRALVDAEPDNLMLLRGLSVPIDRIGDVLHQRGDVDGALVAARESYDIAKKLAGHDPDNMSWQRDLSVSHGKLGTLYGLKGDHARELAEYRAAQVINQRILENDPSNADAEHDVATDQGKIARALFASGDLAGALVAARDGYARIDKLAAREPSNARYQLDLAEAAKTLGDLLVENKDYAGALVLYRRAVAICERLVELDASDSWFQLVLASAYVRTAEMLRRNPRGAAEARQLAGRALTILEKFQSTDSYASIGGASLLADARRLAR